MPDVFSSLFDLSSPLQALVLSRADGPDKESESWTILLDLILLLSIAMVFGVIAERLKQSAVVGYMLAGVIIANVGQPLRDQEENINILANLGVVLLMFTIGLEFNWSRLKRLGLTALASGTMQICLTIAAAMAIGMALLPSWKAAFAIGAALAMSSTAVVLPVLQRRAEADSVHGRFALGVLLVQDLAVVPLVLLVGALGTVPGQDPKGGADILIGIAEGFGWIALFVLGFFLFSRYALPLLVKWAIPTRNRDVMTLFAFLMAMSSAWLAQQLNISPALGALLAAVFLGESIIAPQLRSDVNPLKTVFMTLFFSAIGMYLEIDWFLDNIWLALMLTGIIVVIKPAVVTIVALVMKLTPRSAVAAGCSMAQVGIFSFVIAQIALQGQIIEDDHFKLVVAATVLTLFLTPYTVQLGRPLGSRFDTFLRKRGWSRARIGQEPAAQALAKGHIVVVGYGPAGREVVEAAREQSLPVIVLDLNPASVIEARKLGLEAYVGDASQPAILKLARLQDSSAIVITLPDHRLTTAIIVEARDQCHDATIIARARYHRYFNLLEGAGANIVVDEERQVGRRLSTYIRATSGTSESEEAEQATEKPQQEATA
ncbi:MAG: cation:proton antiporter [Planctomycetota bacterium]